MMKITGLSHLFKWENLHNWWLTKYFFAPLYIHMNIGRGSRHVKPSSCEDRRVQRPPTLSCKDHRLYRAKTIDSIVRLHRAGTPARDISIAFYFSSSLLLISLLFGLVLC